MARLDMFPSEELINHYRKVFSSSAGLEVLTHMLFDLGTFEQVSGGEEDIALKNYGNRLLAILAGGEISQNSIEEFTKRIMRQQLNKE